MPAKLNPDEETVRLYARVPKSVKDWLERQPGGVSKALRRLQKEARWEEEGKTPRDPYAKVDIAGRRRFLKLPATKPEREEARVLVDLGSIDGRAGELVKKLLDTIDALESRVTEST
jgi:hypothetical protein